jgi:putative cardiolipin synthase
VFFNRFTRRLHDKYLIVDHKRFLSGGRNIQDIYFDLADKLSENFVDRDLYLTHEVAYSAREYFYWLWGEDDFEDKNLKYHFQKEPISQADQILMRRELDDALASLEKHPYIQLDQLPFYEREGNQMIQQYSSHFLNDPVGVFLTEKQKRFKVEKSVLKMIREAKKSILIESPYFILNREFEQALKEAIDVRKVSVKVLTASVHSTDGMLPQAAYLNDRKKFVKMGIELYEYDGPKNLHSKYDIKFIKNLIMKFSGLFRLPVLTKRLNTIFNLRRKMILQLVRLFYRKYA